ncbi:MAG: aldose 1-epimerase family protein [Flavipsychrobacter sp.]|nr:aldose 1-epimerase family protein [Flavipsychrobacter sp.]
MLILENELVKVQIATKGAELRSIYHKENSLEYMWNADPAFWPKHSPLLFPIVGLLKDSTYKYKGKNYELPRHGFAWLKEFKVETSSTDKATFLLESDEETLAAYPFTFQLRIHYALEDTKLSVTYDVRNNGKEELYFSVGAHPAFAVPLTKDLSYSDYYLEFNETETLPLYTLKDSLIADAVPFLHAEKRIPLTHELFYKDALVFKHPKSDVISLKTDKNKHGLDYNIGEFPFLGIWAFKDANFVCIEPWEGIADGVNHNQELTEKEGIRHLNAGEMWQKTWSVTIR